MLHTKFRGNRPDATSFSDSLKQVSLTINTQDGGKINHPGQLAPNNPCHQSADQTLFSL